MPSPDCDSCPEGTSVDSLPKVRTPRLGEENSDKPNNDGNEGRRDNQDFRHDVVRDTWSCGKDGLAVNDFRDLAKFDDPYAHLDRAHELARTYGIEFADKEYQRAVDIADCIDQGGVSGDYRNNAEKLRQIERRIEKLESEDSASVQLRESIEERVRLQSEQERLYLLYLSPATTRANMAFAFIGSGREEYVARGKRLLDEALKLRPEIESDEDFQRHKNAAFAQQDKTTDESDPSIEPRGTGPDANNEDGDGSRPRVESPNAPRIEEPGQERQGSASQNDQERGGGESKSKYAPWIVPPGVISPSEPSNSATGEHPDELVNKAKDSSEPTPVDKLKVPEEDIPEPLKPTPIEDGTNLEPGVGEKLAKNAARLALLGWLGYKLVKRGKQWYLKRTQSTNDGSGKPNDGSEGENPKSKEGETPDEKQDGKRDDKTDRKPDAKGPPAPKEGLPGSAEVKNEVIVVPGKDGEPETRNVEVRERTDGGVNVKVKSDGLRERYVDINGESIHLEQKRGQVWFWSEGDHPEIADIKLHVTTVSSNDLFQVQREIMPILEKARKGEITDPELMELNGAVAAYKTIDPNFGVDGNWSNGLMNQLLELGWNAQDASALIFEPGAREQNAKGFTIYLAKGAENKASHIYELLDTYLKRKGLTLEGHPDTGNVSDLSRNPNGSNRTSLELDHLPFTSRRSGAYRTEGGVVQEPVVKAIREYCERKATDWGIAVTDASGKLTQEALNRFVRDAEIDLHMSELTYDSPRRAGEQPRLMFASFDGSGANGNGYYLSDTHTDGKPIGRRAYYEICRFLNRELSRNIEPAMIEVDRAVAQRTGLVDTLTDLPAVNEKTITAHEEKRGDQDKMSGGEASAKEGEKSKSDGPSASNGANDSKSGDSARSGEGTTEETSPFSDPPDQPIAPDTRLRTATVKGPGGIEFRVSEADKPTLVAKLNEEMSEERFERCLEERLSLEKDPKEKERLSRELEAYKKLSSSDRSLARERVVAEAKSKLSDSVEKTGGSAGGKVLGVGGTVIAIGMLADVLLNAILADHHEGTVRPLVTPTVVR